ncbi:hypothetical protein AT15_05535 [Kosmotoga arenicorallina S304]|uniref:Capsule synthesis protein CapA domain-containing protein n=1 Tax=Kosmotoga arenicorallina S304 TaxID=1453497 RepID=A0A176K3E4_9BACT|nr:CapA family protein [Kosmotoga arenicorallina]OAA31536.1 hypothetical protein AT15_05535 [Kosmotoga arenicorallina S304]
MKSFTLILVILILMFTLSGCTLPREGSLEHFTVADVLSYIYKLSFGPVVGKLPEEFSNYLIKENPSRDSTPISFTLLGDIMFTVNIKDEIYQEYPERLKESDFTIANLEFPVNSSKPPSGFPHFNGTVEFFEKAVMPLQPDLLNIANNHCLDQGMEGLYSTIELLNAHKIPFVGVELNSKKYIVLERNGVKIAVTGFTYSTNAMEDAGDWIVNKIRLNRPWNIEDEIAPLISLIQEMNEQADIVIVVLHWGFEYEFTPTDNQIFIAHKLVEAGADMIVGHHPHVLQDFEHYMDKKGHTGLIFYSLGNWITGMKQSYTRTTAAAKVFLDSQGKAIGIEVYPFLLEKGRCLPMINVEENVYVPASFKRCSSW